MNNLQKVLYEPVGFNYFSFFYLNLWLKVKVDKRIQYFLWVISIDQYVGGSCDVEPDLAICFWGDPDAVFSFLKEPSE